MRGRGRQETSSGWGELMTLIRAEGGDGDDGEKGQSEGSVSVRRRKGRDELFEDYAAEHVTDHTWPMCGHSLSFILHSGLGLLSTSHSSRFPGTGGCCSGRGKAESTDPALPGHTRGAGPVGVQNRDLLPAGPGLCQPAGAAV